jgi:hypothetical protein
VRSWFGELDICVDVDMFVFADVIVDVDVDVFVRGSGVVFVHLLAWVRDDDLRDAPE